MNINPIHSQHSAKAARVEMNLGANPNYDSPFEALANWIANPSSGNFAGFPTSLPTDPNDLLAIGQCFNTFINGNNGAGGLSLTTWAKANPTAFKAIQAALTPLLSGTPTTADLTALGTAISSANIKLDVGADIAAGNYAACYAQPMVDLLNNMQGELQTSISNNQLTAPEYYMLQFGAAIGHTFANGCNDAGSPYSMYQNGGSHHTATNVIGELNNIFDLKNGKGNFYAFMQDITNYVKGGGALPASLTSNNFFFTACAAEGNLSSAIPDIDMSIYNATQPNAPQNFDPNYGG